MFIFRGGNSYQLQVFELLEVHQIPWWFAQKKKIPYKHTEIQALLSRMRAIQVIIQVYMYQGILPQVFFVIITWLLQWKFVSLVLAPLRNMINFIWWNNEKLHHSVFLELGKTEKTCFPTENNHGKFCWTFCSPWKIIFLRLEIGTQRCKL